MEKQTLLLSKLSLEEMAVRKLVVHHWSQTEIFVLVEEFPFDRKTGKAGLWRETVESKVEENIWKLLIPEPLKRRMIQLVRPIGLQIPEWEIFMAQCLYDSRINLDVNILKLLCWTSFGTIDYAKTAEKLVNLETIDVVTRFKIACGHCLVDSLRVVWEELPGEYKIGFIKWLIKNRIDILGEKFLQIYWFFVLYRVESQLLEIDRNCYASLFECSVKTGNKAATEYFFQKLDNDYSLESILFDELTRVLARVALLDLPLEKKPDVFCYLFFKTAPGVQLKVLTESPGCLFRVFLHWPWQDLFLDFADPLLNFPLEDHMYDHLLIYIRMKIEYSDYYFPELFQEFFRRSPLDFRKHFVNNECLGSGPPLFSRFLMNEDIETVRTVLSNIEVKDRFRLVSIPDVFRALNFHLGQTDVVELCVRGACPSREDRERLKKVYMQLHRLEENHETMKSKRQWQQFFKSLDDPKMPVGRRLG